MRALLGGQRGREAEGVRGEEEGGEVEAERGGEGEGSREGRSEKKVEVSRRRSMIVPASQEGRGVPEM